MRWLRVVTSRANTALGTGTTPAPRREQSSPGTGATPADCPAAPEGSVHRCSTSRGGTLPRQKIGYLRDLSHKVVSGASPLDEVDRMNDDELIAHLVQVKGIGRWTAQMFLMFRLGRRNVLPELDLGIQNAIRRAYGSESDRALNKSARSARSGVRTAQSRLGTYGDLSRTEMARARPESAAPRGGDMTATTLPAPSFAERVSPTQLPLERKLPILVLALFSVILGAWALASYYETRRAAEAGAAERLSTLVRVVSTTIEQTYNMPWRPSRPPRTTRPSCPRFALRRVRSRPRRRARFWRCRHQQRTRRRSSGRRTAA